MSVKNCPSVSQRVIKFQTAVYPQMSVVDSRTNYIENLDDSLVVEDLDLGDLEISSSSVRESASTGKYDYDFEDQIPEVIYEACTQNNLYILVKVPTSTKKLPSNATTTAFSQTTPNMSEESATSYSNANRTIFPILEEEIPNSIEETPFTKPRHHKVTCWTKDNEAKEEFSSRTNIIGEAIPCLLPNQVPDPTEKEEHFVPDNHPAPIRCQNQIELQELNLNAVQFRGPPNVSLENYGILITPTKKPKTENLLVFQVDTEGEKTKRSNGSSCFQWLRKLFRMEQRSSGLVHAKVYKTYFVKWKKCSEETKCSCPRQIYAKGQKFRRNST